MLSPFKSFLTGAGCATGVLVSATGGCFAAQPANKTTDATKAKNSAIFFMINLQIYLYFIYAILNFLLVIASPAFFAERGNPQTYSYGSSQLNAKLDSRSR